MPMTLLGERSQHKAHWSFYAYDPARTPNTLSLTLCSFMTIQLLVLGSLWRCPTSNLSASRSRPFGTMKLTQFHYGLKPQTSIPGYVPGAF